MCDSAEKVEKVENNENKQNENVNVAAPAPVPTPVIEVIGNIDINNVAGIINAIDQTIKNTPNISKIQINYSSPGGDIMSGLALYNYLRSQTVTVRMVNTGMIASMGVIVYLAADERYAVKNSSFMIHQIKTNYPNNNNIDCFQSSEVAEVLETYTNAYINIFNERINGAVKKIDISNNLKGFPAMITPESAVEYGIAHKVIAPEDIRKLDGKI